MKKEELSFWLTNISKLNVSLSDLNITIKPYTSVNLMDTRHYSYSFDQLVKSAESGSIFKKRDKLVVRQNAPEILKKHVLFNRDTFIPTRERSGVVITEENYEELNVSDEDFAKNSAELDELDNEKEKKG